MIFAKERDLRLVTVRRGGTLTEDNHRLLVLWAAQCAGHVLHMFEETLPDDDRPGLAIKAAKAWALGQMPMMKARAAGGEANGAARPLTGPARDAAYAAGQAACVPHVAEHALGAAAYAIRAARAAAEKNETHEAGRAECAWQRAQLPNQIRDLVLDDQRRRNQYCWNLFDIDPPKP